MRRGFHGGGVGEGVGRRLWWRGCGGGGWRLREGRGGERWIARVSYARERGLLCDSERERDRAEGWMDGWMDRCLPCH